MQPFSSHKRAVEWLNANASGVVCVGVVMNRSGRVQHYIAEQFEVFGWALMRKIETHKRTRSNAIAIGATK